MTWSVFDLTCVAPAHFALSDQRLNAGDLYVFFTDGITEAMNEQDDCFGEDRLGRLVEDHAHLPSAELRERLYARAR